MSSTTTTAVTERPARLDLWAYVQIARVDHWFKNVFMILGVILAAFYEPRVIAWSSLAPLFVGVLATCLVASSNYVLNELLDGPNDMLHPEKRFRPVPSGRVRPALAYAEWLLLAAVGFALSASLNYYFFASAVWLWVMGIALQRAADPHEGMAVSGRAERVGQQPDPPAARLVRARVRTIFPPVSLAISYWMVGAFFMAMKRYAEYRHIGDPPRRRGLPRIVRVLHGGSAAHQPVLLRDVVRAVRRHLHRPLSSGADPVRAARRGTVRVLHEDRPSARQSGAESGEAVQAARLSGLPDRLHRDVHRADVHQHPEHV